MKRQRTAHLVSNILNPFWLSLALILTLSFVSAPTKLDAIKWSLIAAAFSILPVFVVIILLVRKGKLDAVYINVRRQRTKIYFLVGLCTIVGSILLAYLKAPPLLVAAFISGLSTAFIFMFINLWWKISLHTAFVAGSATILVIVFGWTAIISMPLIPLTAWSRVELKRHSLSQVVGGALLATVIAVVVFNRFALA